MSETHRIDNGTDKERALGRSIVVLIKRNDDLITERDAYREELDRVRRTAKKHGRLVNIPRSVLVAIEVIARNVLSKYSEKDV